MEFAEPLPKTNAPTEGESGLVFCSTEEGVKEIFKERPAGRGLFVTDGSALKAFRSCLPSRALCLVLDSDGCLSLFRTSDDLSYVVAAGKKSTLVSARFFAEIRKIPCTVFPVSMAFDGAYERFGNVRFSGGEERVPLKEAKVCCDGEIVCDSAGQAYMRLLLSRLALIEAKAMRLFGADHGREEAEERAYSALLTLRAETLDIRSIALKNAAIRQCERDGMNGGEGAVLVETIGREGEEQAFFLLSALYAAFFERGKARLNVPDYAARARYANVSYAAQKVPTVAEFALRAARLERMRSDLYRELNAFLGGTIHYRNNFFSLAGRRVSEERNLSALRMLPELTVGLSSLIRDFGLMEWREDGIRKDILKKSV